MVLRRECELAASNKSATLMAHVELDRDQMLPVESGTLKPKKKTKGEESREHILQLGAHMFSNAQYKGATMRDIAREGGISLGGVYFHFKSKDELIGAIIERSVRASYNQVLAALAALPSKSSSKEKLTAAIHAFISSALKAGAFSLTNRHLRDHAAPMTVSAEYSLSREAHRRLWLDLLIEAQADGTLKADAPPIMMFFFLLGAMNWVIEWYDPKRMSIDRIGDHFSDFFLSGLGADR